MSMMTSAIEHEVVAMTENGFIMMAIVVEKVFCPVPEGIASRPHGVGYVIDHSLRNIISFTAPSYEYAVLCYRCLSM